MTSTKTDELANVGVLVTRPAHQAEPLCRLIDQHGGVPIRFPVLEIVDLEDKRRLMSQIQRLNEFDMAIFISPNAVKKAIHYVGLRANWPSGLKIAAVGESSAKALDRAGLIVDIFPSRRFNSEALLELDAMQHVEGKRIIIFRGEGGRALLGDTLTQRGAEVEYAACYRRQKPEIDASILVNQWINDKIHLIICTSNEGLRNLYDMVGTADRHLLLNTSVIVVSERGADLAVQLGFSSRPLVANRASDDAILNSILLWSKMDRS